MAPTAALAILLVDHPEANVYELPVDATYDGPEVLNPAASP